MKKCIYVTLAYQININDNYFAWTKFGLIPVIRYSDIVFCGTTFISVDMLNEKQKELWDSVHSKLLEHNLLKE